MVGRYDLIYVWGFSFFEFLEFKGINIANVEIKDLNKFLIDQLKPYFFEYLKFGGYPAVVTATTQEDKKEKLASIVEDYFLKDVRSLLDRLDFLNFNKALKVLAERVGSTFSVSSFVQEVGFSRYYFDKIKFVLENTFLIKFVPTFVGGKDKLELKKSQKVYFYDVGIWRYFLGLDDWIGDFKGKAVENFVFFELITNLRRYEELYFWQRKNETEIDFVVLDKIDKILKLVEVK